MSADSSKIKMTSNQVLERLQDDCVYKLLVGINWYNHIENQFENM